MANETDDLTLRMRTRGMRQGAREVDRTSSALKRASKASNVSLRSFTKLGGGLRVMAGGAAAVGAGVAGMAAILGKKAIDEFREAQKVGNQTSAVLKSMGATSWTSSKQIGDLANSISVKTGIDDEAIQSASNLLLTFGKVRNEAGQGGDIFDRATKAAVDLSAAGFGSMTSTGKQLGKALNDPVKGITALNKSGVTFTQKQKDTIKTLVAQNKTLDAQKIIIGEVERQVKGSAAAQADPIDKMTVAWNNMLEVAGKPIWGVVTRGINRLIGPLTHVSSTASEVFDDKNLNWQQKFQAIGRSVRHWFGPIATDMVQGLRDAHLDQKLNALMRWTSPKVSAAFATMAPMAAGAFIRGFKAAPVWAQALTALWIFGKTKPMWDGLGRLAGAASCGKLKGNMGACLGKSGAPAGAASFGAKLGRAVGMAAWPIALALLVNELSSNEPGKQAESANPEGVRPHHRIAPGDGPTGAQIYGRRTHDPIPANTEASRGYRGIPQPAAPIRRKGADTHVTVEVDGKAVATATARATKREKARR